MKAWHWRRRWQQSSPEGDSGDDELSGDLRDMMRSRAWKAASPICRAAAGDSSGMTDPYVKRPGARRT